MKLGKRLLALLLALTMVLSNLPVSVLAEEFQELTAETNAEISTEPVETQMETTQAPTETPVETEEPTETPTEAPEETGEVQETPSPEPTAAVETDEILVEAAEEAVDETVSGDHPSFVSYEWLGFDAANNTYYQQDGGRQTAYHVRPGDAFYHIYYLNTWDDTAEEYTAAPTKVYSSNSYVSVESVAGQAAAGDPLAAYYCKVTANAWDMSASIYSEDDPDALPLDAATSLGIDSFHSSEACNNSTFITGFTIDPDAQENAFYFRLYDEGDYWELISGLTLESTDKATMEMVGDLGDANANTGVYKITLRPDYIQSLVDAGETAFPQVTVTHRVQSVGNPDDPDHQETWTLSMWCAYNPETSGGDQNPDDSGNAPYLTATWLTYDHQGCSNTMGADHVQRYHIYPGEPQYNMFFLNVWDDARGEYVEQGPVQVRCDNDALNLSQDMQIAPGFEHEAQYYYMATANQWGVDDVEIYCDYNGQRASMSVSTDLDTTSFHNALPCGYDTYVSWLTLDADAQENVAYFRFDHGEWKPGTVSLVNDSAGLGSVKDLGGGIYEITLYASFMDGQQEGNRLLWVEVEMLDQNNQVIGSWPTQIDARWMSRAPYLSFTWLNHDGVGFFVDGEPDGREFNLHSQADAWHMYYLNTWDEAQGRFVSTPVHVESDNETIILDWLPESASPNEPNPEYICRVWATEWDQVGNLYYMHEGQKLTVTVRVELGETSYHSGLPASTENCISNYRVDPNAAENAVYFRFESGYWQLNDLWLADETAGTVEPQGSGIFKLIMSDAFIQSVLEYDHALDLRLDVQAIDNPEDRHTWDDAIHCMADRQDTSSYLSHGWLQNWGEGWVEDGDHDGRDFSIVPNEPFHMIYYMNVWNEERQEFDSWPVQVQIEGNFNLEPIGGEAMEGAEDPQCYYRLSTDSWDNEGWIYYIHEGERYEMRVWSGLDTVSHHSGPDCTTDNYISKYLVDSSAQENAFYVRFVHDDLELVELRPVPEHEGRASFQRVNDNLYKVVLEPWFVQEVKLYGEQGIEYILDMQSKRDGHTEQWHNYIGVACTEPYLSLRGLYNEGDGWRVHWDSGEGRDFRVCPGDEMLQVYWLNVWNEEHQEYDFWPVEVSADSSFLKLEKLSAEEIAPDEHFGQWFYRVTATEWNKEGTLYYDYEGQRLTLPVNSYLGEESFHSGSPCTTDNYMSQWAVDPFAEQNTAYFRFQSDYWKIESIALADFVADMAVLQKVEEGLYKVTLTDAAMGRVLDGQDIVLDLQLQAKDDPNHREFRNAGIWCHVDLGERKAMLVISGETYEFFGENKILHQYYNGEYWAVEAVNALPAGISYNLSANKLTLNNAKLTNLNLGYRWYDEEGNIAGQNLPNGNLTIELVGDNTIINDYDGAMHFYGNLNVTFVGSGSLKVKATNSESNRDPWGNAYHYPAWNMEGGKLTLSGSVKVTVEIAGKGLETILDDSGENIIAEFPANLNAMTLHQTQVVLESKASLTTLVPKGARSNGEWRDEPTIWGDHTPGGYTGIAGFRSLKVTGSAVLNTQDLHLDPIRNEDGSFGAGGSYLQEGGTVNITALGGGSMQEEFDQEGNPTGKTYYHAHYEGLTNYGSGSIVIRGGTLNITAKPTAQELAVSSYTVGIGLNGGELKVEGGTVNFHADGSGEMISAMGFFGDNGELLGKSSVNISGGTFNAKTDVNTLRYFVIVGTEGKINITGGVYELEQCELFFDTMDAKINGGRFNMIESVLTNTMSLEFLSGEINIDNRGAKFELPWCAVANMNYFVLAENAVLNVWDDQEGVTVGNWGHLQVGGKFNVYHYNNTEPAVYMGYMDGEPEETTSLFLRNGEFNIYGSDGTAVGVSSDAGQNIVLKGGKLNLNNAGMCLDGCIQVGTDEGDQAQLNITGGRFEMHDKAEMLILDGGTVVVDAVRPENFKEEWYSAFHGSWDTSLTVEGGKLTIQAENAVGMDMCGSYAQTGGVVTIESSGGWVYAGEEYTPCGASVKTGFLLEGGTLNIKAPGTALELGFTWEEGDPKAVNRISGGTLNLEAEDAGIALEAVMDITGGDINIYVTGTLYDAPNAPGGKVQVGNGIWLYLGTEAEPGFSSSLTMTGGDLTISFGEPQAGLEYEFDSIISSDCMVKLLGGTYRSIGGTPLITMGRSQKNLFVIGDKMAMYSLTGGNKLTPVDIVNHFDKDGNPVDAPVDGGITQYLRFFTEDNVQGQPGADPGVQWAVDTVAVPSTCGASATWELSGTTLMIQGTGALNSYSAKNPAPWTELADFITRVQVGEKVTYIGAFAFNGLDQLQYISFLGDAPGFHANAFAGIKASVEYPADNETWTADLLKNYGGDIQWSQSAGKGMVVDVESDVKYLVSGGKAKLTAVLSGADEDTEVQWSLAEGSEDYATLSVKSGVATITAKTVTQKQTIQVYASVKDSKAPPYKFELDVYAKAKAVALYYEGDNVTGGEVSFDYEQKKTLVLTAELDPNDLAAVLDPSVEWESSNEKIATVEDGVVTFKAHGEVKITAKALDGSGKKATVELVPYFRYEGKLTGKLSDKTLLLNKPAEDGLQVGDELRVLAVAEDGTVLPADELTYEITSGDKYATIDEDGIVTAVAEKGTVKVKLTLKGDPDKRTATVTLKTTPTKPDSILLVPAEEDMGYVTGGYYDVDGFTEEKDGTWSLNVKAGDKKTFTMTALGQHGIIGEMSVKGAVTWTTSNRSIASAKEASNGTVTVTISKNAEGTCVITGTSKLDEKVKVTLNVSAVDFAPQLEEDTISLNSLKYQDSETLALTFHEKDPVQAVEILAYSKADKDYTDDSTFQAEYADGEVTVTAMEAADKGKVKAQLVLYTKYNEYPVDITIKVDNSAPKVTVKQTQKLNTLEELQGLLKITVPEGEELTEVTLTDCGYEILNPDAKDGVYMVGLSKEEDADYADFSGTLNFALKGYQGMTQTIRLTNDSKSTNLEMNKYQDTPTATMAIPMDAAVEVWEYVKSSKSYVPSDRLDAYVEDGKVTIEATDTLEKGTIKAQLVIWAADGQRSGIRNLSIKVTDKIPTVTVKQIRKVNLKDPNSYGLLKVTVKNAVVEDVSLKGGNFFVDGKDAEGNYIIVHDGSEDKVTKGTLTVELENFAQATSKKLTVSTEKKDNKAILGQTTVSLFANLPEMEATTTLTTYFVKSTIKTCEFTSSKAGSEKLNVEYAKGVITVSAPDGMPKTGSYKFTAVPYDESGEALAKISLTVKVEAAPKVKVKPTTAKLKLSERGKVTTVEVTAPEAINYPLTFKEITNGTYIANNEIDLKYNAETGNLEAILKAACTTTGKRVIYLTPMYGDVAATQVKLTVNVSK